MAETLQPDNWQSITYYEAGNPNPLGSLGEPQVHGEVSGLPELVTEVPAEILQATGEVALEGAGVPREAVQEVESARERRNRELFAPLPYLQKPSAEKAPEPENYDFMFADDDTYYGQAPKADKFGNKERQWLPTEATRAAASSRLIDAARKDTELAKLIQSQAGQIDLGNPLAVVDAIRLKPDFRLAVGGHLLKKMDAYANIGGAMPDRIERNTDKSPDKGGYHVANMTSREYATLLALSMIDGTFDDAMVSASDRIERQGTSGIGPVRQGQHRAAAMRVLEIAN